MATVRPISPQYQHTLDSAISLAKELASKNMAESRESSPKTPNSPDKKKFSFKLKHFSKSFSEASANIRDIESSITYEAKQAYKTLVERGPYNSYNNQYNNNNHHHHSTLGSANHNGLASNHHHQHHTAAIAGHHHLQNHHHHHHTMGHPRGHSNLDELSPTFQTSNKMKHMTLSMKKTFF